MAASSNPKKQNSLWLLLLFLLFLGIITVIVIALFAIFVSRAPSAVDLLVAIDSPANGLTYNGKSLFSYTAHATHPDGISRIELYDNGQLILVQKAEGGSKKNTLTASLLWHPRTVGRHLLMARAYTLRSQKGFSPVVILDVPANQNVTLSPKTLRSSPDSPNPSLDDVARLTGLTLTDLINANPWWSGHSPTEPLPDDPPVTLPAPAPAPSDPAGIVPPSPGGGVPPGSPSSPGATLPPAAPPSPGVPSIPRWLTVDSSPCTSISLEWYDNPEETSYRLYRMAPGDSTLNLIATLPANTTRFTDPISLPGMYAYQLGAVNASGETLSAVQGTTPSASCFPAPPVTPISLSVLGLTTNELYDGLYCYYSVDGGLAERLPAIEPNSLLPGSDGRNFPVTSELPGGGVFGLTGHPGSLPVTMSIKCRGYRGAFSLDLGRVDISHPQPDWDGSERTASASGFSLRYCINTGSTPCGTRTGTITIPVIPIFFFMPSPTNLVIRNTLDACDEYAGGDPVRLFGCYLSGIFGVGQNTLYWDWSPGVSLWTESTLTGYRIHAVASDLSGGGVSEYFIHDITPGTRKFGLALLPTECGKRVTYTVEAVSGSAVSLPSDPLTYSTPACPTASRIYIDFQNFSLGPIDDDGDSWVIPPPRDDVLELSAYLLVQKGSDPVLQRGTHPASQPWREGTFNLANLRIMNFAPLPSYVGDYNNTFDVTVTDETTPIVFTFAANDEDSNCLGACPSDYTDLCSLTQVLEPRSLAQWIALDQEFELEGASSTETYCRVRVHVKGNPVP